MPDVAVQAAEAYKYEQWVEGFAEKHTDISDHLMTLYKTAVSSKPTLIVELGVRGADSSRVLGKAAQECDALLIGVDIMDCDYHDMPNAIFCKMDDIRFAERFRDFCKKTIDVLFIDTSHLYDHTLQEVESFFPLLSDNAVVIFHDTNMAKEYKRRDGSTGTAWDNDRGVIRAIETYFDIELQETHEFTTQVDKGGDSWLLTQNPFCNGLMMCRKTKHVQ